MESLRFFISFSDGDSEEWKKMKMNWRKGV